MSASVPGCTPCPLHNHAGKLLCTYPVHPEEMKGRTVLWAVEAAIACDLRDQRFLPRQALKLPHAQQVILMAIFIDKKPAAWA